jgi:hypothetical protein
MTGMSDKPRVIMLMKEAARLGAPPEVLSVFPHDAAYPHDADFVDWKAVETRLTAWLRRRLCVPDGASLSEDRFAQPAYVANTDGPAFD